MKVRKRTTEETLELDPHAQLPYPRSIDEFPEPLITTFREITLELVTRMVIPGGMMQESSVVFCRHCDKAGAVVTTPVKNRLIQRCKMSGQR
jgi:hypothetical protein